MRGAIIISPELKGLGAFLAYAIVRGVEASRGSDRVNAMLAEEEARIRSRFGDPSGLTRDEVVQSLRKFLWKLGIDPTKVRPSSEALARRVLRGSPIPRINSVVDTGNLVSLRTLVPIGLYDLDKIELPLELRLSRGGELFEGLGSDRAEALGRGVPILIDARGLVIHIYPHRDSRVSAISGSTRNVLIVACGAPGMPRELVRGAAEEVARILAELNPGAEASEVVVQ